MLQYLFTIRIFHVGTRYLSARKNKLEFAESKLKKIMWAETEAKISFNYNTM